MLAKMTDQEIFDAVWKGAKAQGFVQSVGDRGCAYRGINGLKCNAGHLIPDEMYDPGIEGEDAYEAFHRLGIEIANIYLVFQLQSIHDNAFDEEEHEHNLRTLAKEQGLTIPE